MTIMWERTGDTCCRLCVGVRSAGRALFDWWARTSAPEFLSSQANCRDLWIVLLPMYGLLAMCLDLGFDAGLDASLDAATPGNGAPKGDSLSAALSVNIAVNVAVSMALFGASLLPRRTWLSDFCVAAVFGAHLVCRQVAFGIEARASLGACQLLATLAMTSAGTHSLAVAAFVAACASASRQPESVICLYVLGASVLSEHRIAMLFAHKSAGSYKVLETPHAEDGSQSFAHETQQQLQLPGAKLGNSKGDSVSCIRRSTTSTLPLKLSSPSVDGLPLLVLEPERELVFVSGSSHCVLRLENISHSFVAFTVRAKQQHVWHVRPHKGTIARGQSIEVTITRKDRRATITAGALTDELLVRAASRESSDTVRSELWRHIPRDAIQEWFYGVRRGEASSNSRDDVALPVISPTPLGRTPESAMLEV